MIFEDTVVANDVSTDAIRRRLSWLSDDELIADYSFLSFVDKYDFAFGVDSEASLYLCNYAILVCEEMAKRFFKNYVFMEVY